MATSVYCIAQNDSTAVAIVDQLRSSGFGGNDVSVLFPDKSTTKDFAHEMHTKAPEGAATGASGGGILGGALGWLVGIGTLAIPGVGPLIAAGPILAALSGAAVGAAVGGIAGALIGAGIPEVEAKRYEAKLRDGRILISVNATDSKQVAIAKQIFKDAGAEDIASAAEAKVNQGADARRAERGRDTTRPDVVRGQGGSKA
jgi:hypothetical protein